MGARYFETVASGPTPDAAFRQAVEAARHECGHGGGTGTIAEKESVIRIKPPPGERALAYARKLAYDGLHEVCDKWGPCGCIRLPNDGWLLFGFAPD